LSKQEWTFLTNHGRVFSYVAKYPCTTSRDLAQLVGITERAVQRIIAELAAEGYIVRHKEGRRNCYEVHSELPMRHPMERDHAVRDLLEAMGWNLENDQESI